MPYTSCFHGLADNLNKNFNKTFTYIKSRVLIPPLRRSSNRRSKNNPCQLERERRERRYIHTQLAHVVTASISCVFLFEQEVESNMLIPWWEFLAGDGKYFWLVNVEFRVCISSCHLLVSFLLTSFWQSGLMYCTYRKCKMYESPVFISYHNDCMSCRFRECRTLIKFSAVTLLTFML